MSWLLNRIRERRLSLEREADSLIDGMGAAAYAAAARMAREANDFSGMRYWVAVQAIIARKTRRRLRDARQANPCQRARDDGSNGEPAVERYFAPPAEPIAGKREFRDDLADSEPPEPPPPTRKERIRLATSR